jgi:predicted secreted protein
MGTVLPSGDSVVAQGGQVQLVASLGVPVRPRIPGIRNAYRVLHTSMLAATYLKLWYAVLNFMLISCSEAQFSNSSRKRNNYGSMISAQ